MKKMIQMLAVIATFSLTSCEQVASILEETGITNDESVEALKTALVMGIDSGTADISKLSYSNYTFSKADPSGVNSRGFQEYKDSLILKILLPDSVQKVMKKIKDNDALNSTFTTFMGMSAELMEKELVSKFNSAADSAAPRSIAVFRSAITDSMSVSDGMRVLTAKDNNGNQDSIAATNYLHSTTHTSLVNLYSPIMDNALSQVGAVTAWNNFATIYNTKLISNFNSNPLTALLVKDFPQSLPTNLSDYATGKALDGLFTVVGYEEIKIRRNPFAYASGVVQRVFSKL